MAAIVGDIGAITAAVAAVIGRRSAVIAVGLVGPSAVIGRTAMVVAAILRSGDREARADDAGERCRSGRAAATTIIAPASGAEIRGIAGGRHRGHDLIGLGS